MSTHIVNSNAFEERRTILVLGYGSMALAVIEGMLEYGLDRLYKLEITGRDPAKLSTILKLKSLDQKIEILHPKKKDPSYQDRGTVIEVDKKIIFLCVKSHALDSFEYEGLAGGCLSLLAGVSIQELCGFISSSWYVRIMPNIAAKYQKSSTTAFFSPAQNFIAEASSNSQESLDFSKAEAEKIISTFGICCWVDKEELIDSSIATSGSSPAFLALIAQALIESGVKEGLSREQSKLLVRATFHGFSALLSQKEPQDIIDAITSPGGTTAEGLAILEKYGVRGAIIQAGAKAVSKAKAASKITKRNGNF